MTISSKNYARFAKKLNWLKCRIIFPRV